MLQILSIVSDDTDLLLNKIDIFCAVSKIVIITPDCMSKIARDFLACDFARNTPEYALKSNFRRMYQCLV